MDTANCSAIESQPSRFDNPQTPSLHFDSADDAVNLTSNPSDKRTLLRVWANGGSHYVVVDESKSS